LLRRYNLIKPTLSRLILADFARRSLEFVRNIVGVFFLVGFGKQGNPGGIDFRLLMEGYFRRRHDELGLIRGFLHYLLVKFDFLARQTLRDYLLEF
jgi:hypothetical protein